LDHGPALSHVHDLIKGKAARAGEWAHFIRTTHHWVALRQPTGRGKLNKAEIEKLQMEAGDRFYLPAKAADGHLWISVASRYRDGSIWSTSS
jgi:hypothetical protein